MRLVPTFDYEGLLPPADYELSFDELRQSVLVLGPHEGTEQTAWDTPWRAQLVDNVEIVTRQLWRVGIREVFLDGSFAEDKDHPNDVDGYFVCTLDQLRTGELVRQLNLLDPYKVWTWDPASRKPYRGYPIEATSDVESLPRRVVSSRAGARFRQRHSRQTRA